MGTGCGAGAAAATPRPRSARVTRALALLGCAAAVLMVGACGGSGPTPSTGSTAQVTGEPSVSTGARTLEPATLIRGEAIPEPSGKAVLVISGKVTARNTGTAVTLDIDTIGRMGVVQVELYEPWAKKRQTFRGAWLADVLAVAGVPADATSLHITGLDDYQVDLSMSDVRRGGILLATADGTGSGLAIDLGGPTRVVFADGIKAGANPDQWIWSLKSIDVR